MPLDMKYNTAEAFAIVSLARAHPKYPIFHDCGSSAKLNLRESMDYVLRNPPKENV